MQSEVHASETSCRNITFMSKRHLLPVYITMLAQLQVQDVNLTLLQTKFTTRKTILVLPVMQLA